MFKIIQYGLIASSTSVACAEVVRPESEVFVVQAGSEVSVLWMLEQSSVPLFGYSLDLNLTPDSGGNRQGSVIVNADLTNFFDSQNLISAGGGTRDSFFSVIIPDGSGGVFLSTNTSDTQSAFVAQSGVNDVLSEVFFSVSADAKGDFVFALGDGTALSNRDGFSVDFAAENLMIRVVPSPTPAGLFGLMVFTAIMRRRPENSISIR